MSTYIEVELAILDLCPLGHADHTSVLNDLEIAYSSCYDQDGNIADLNRSIEVFQKRLDLCPLEHPQHAKAFGGLAVALSRHYDIQRNQEDLNRLIDIKQAWLDFCPLGHSSYAKTLGSFAASLFDHYSAQGTIADLNKAIGMEEKRLELCPTGHPDHGTALNNLALSLRAHYQKLGDLTDMDRTIDLQEKCLELCSHGHQYHGSALQNLAQSFWDRYHKKNNHSDLSGANKLYKETLETYPAHHISFASNVSNIAQTTLLLSSSSNDQQPSLVDEAFQAYRLLKKCGPAVSLNLLKAIQAWIKDAERHNHSSVLEAYNMLLTTLDYFSSLNSSLDSQHKSMQARVANAANSAFSCAARHGDFQVAIELLEQGRGILWNQLARFDISVAVLESGGDRERELARKFTQLSADLRKHAQGSVSQGTDPYWRVQEEWQLR